MAMTSRRDGRILSALYDTWTLHSWSEWLAGSARGVDDDVLILHVADHRDLGAPRLFVEDSGWRDAITGAPCTLNDPGSVQDAIARGALGMGSFLTQFRWGERRVGEGGVSSGR